MVNESSDLLFEIAIQTPYRHLNNLISANRFLAQLASSEHFWQRKALNDFDQPLAIDQSLSPKLRYLKLLSQSDCQIGSERFQSVFRCLQTVIKKNDLMLVKYFANIADLQALYNALYRASELGYLDIFKYLVKMIESKGGVLSTSVQEYVLRSAISGNQYELVGYVISTLGFAIETALQIAIFRGKLDMIKYLLRHPININIVNRSLKLAISFGNVTLIDMLIKAGANDFEHAIHVARQFRYC